MPICGILLIKSTESAAMPFEKMKLLLLLPFLLAVAFWVISILLLRKVREGGKIIWLNLVLLMIVWFGPPLLFPKALYVGIALWIPAIPFIYGLILLIVALILKFDKNPQEGSPFRFSWVGTLVALLLCGMFFYYLRVHTGL
jgi:hypothetical protein